MPKATSLPCSANGHGVADALVKARNIPDQMVCGENEKQRIIAIPHGVERGKRDCRGGIAAGRLEQDRGVFLADQPQLLGGDKAMLLVANQDRVTAAKAGETIHGLLQHGQPARKRVELLGIKLA